MKFLKNRVLRLRVGVKLALGFGVVMALAGLIIALALDRLATLDAVIGDITAKGLPRFELMHTIVDEAGKLTRDSHGVMLATDSAGRAQQMVRFNRTRARFGELLGRFDELRGDFVGNDDAINSRLQAAISDYLVSIIAFSRIDDKTQRAERERLAASLELKLATLAEVLQQYQAQEIAHINALSARAHDLYSSGIRTLAMLAAAAAVIAVIFIWWLTRSISRRLRHSVEIANAIATGRFDNEIVSDSRDETGEMLSALDVMQTNLSDSFHSLELRNREAAIVTEISNLLQTARDMREAAEILSRSIVRALAPHAGAIYLTAPSLNRLDCIAQGDGANFAPMIALADCLALRRGRSHGVTDPEHDVYCPHVPADARGQACLCVPMMTQGASLGMLHVTLASHGLRPGNQAAEQLRIQRFADEISLALANIRLRETLRDQSIRDALTGLYNRRYLEESLERELSHAQRAGGPLAVFMLDVDHFKKFNDTHGHEAGDAVLRSLGKTLQQACRASDLACRFGGEEFTVMLPDTLEEGAAQWALRLMQCVRAIDLNHDGRSLGRITISMGLAMFPENGEDVDTLLQAADLALYEAKHAGRNRLVVFRPPGVTAGDQAAAG